MLRMVEDLQRNAPLHEERLVDLLLGAQRGDPKAFDGLYLLYADRVFRYLMVRTGSAELAEEVTAQVFLRLLQKIGLYRIAPQDNVAIFSAWLYRLAHNRLVDLLRKQYRTAAVSLDHAQMVEDSSPLLQTVEERIDFEVIMGKLNLLNEQQRTVLVLRFVDDYSIAETAEIMQKNEGAVKALQHRALENLRRHMKAAS